MIATPTTTTMATMPAPGRRRFRITLLRSGGAFFGGIRSLFPLSLDFVFVLNWLLLLQCLECFCFDRLMRFCCLPLLLEARCSLSLEDLPECVPGKSSKESEKDERTCP